MKNITANKSIYSLMVEIPNEAGFRLYAKYVNFDFREVRAIATCLPPTWTFVIKENN